MQVLRSAVTIGAFTLLSRFSGFARDVLFAAIIGAGPMADAFLVAFKLPNFLRRMLGEGAFGAAFVPLYAGMLEGEGEPVARRFAEEALAVMATTLAAIVVVAELFMPWVIRIVAPGFALDDPRFAAAVTLTRITYPYLFFVCLVALIGGVLNSLGRFAAAAAVPVLLNVVLILALLIGRQLPPYEAVAVAVGVTVAGILQLAAVWYTAWRAGTTLRPRWPRLTPKVRRLFRLMLPGMIGAGVGQINLVVALIFASTLPAGAVSFLYFADRITMLPLGLVGTAIGTALLPLLSRQLRAGDSVGARDSQNRAIEMALFLTLPAGAALTVLAHPIVELLYERGAFGSVETAATAEALAIYGLAVPAYVLAKVTLPAFFARQDTSTPVVISVTCLVLNGLLTWLLVGPLAHVGIALAQVLTAWLNAVLLGVVALRRGNLAIDARLRARFPRILLVTVLLVFFLVGLPSLMPGVSGRIAIVVVIALGGVAYVGASQLLRACDLREMASLLRRRRA